MSDTEFLLERFKVSRRVDTDTRKLRQGSIFFALRGENFDGNQYAAQALEQGASLAVVDDPKIAIEGQPFYLVPDSLQALQDLARAWRRTFSIPFLGITGSNGKTTTKELVTAVLNTEKKVYATPGNYNNHIGVPLTLLGIPPETELAVVEMGTNQPGDIAELVAIAEPTEGLITNIGYAHIEKLGSLDGVAEEKGALYHWLAGHDGVGFVNQTDQRVVGQATGISQQITYGTTNSDFHAELQDQSAAGMRLKIQGRNWKKPIPFETQLNGDYNLLNILAAVAIGDHFGISIPNLQKGIAGYVPANMRSQTLQKNGREIFLDAYNANPSSMTAAVKFFLEKHPEGAVLILGDMLELGDIGPEMHRDLGRLIANYQPAYTIGVGQLMQHLIEEAPEPKVCYPNVSAAMQDLPGLIKNANSILIKGSRGMALEKVLDVL